jgi:hypothetical protein
MMLSFHPPVISLIFDLINENHSIFSAKYNFSLIAGDVTDYSGFHG